MNRRDFLKVATAIAASRAVPLPHFTGEGIDEKLISIDDLRRIVKILKQNKILEGGLISLNPTQRAYELLQRNAIFAPTKEIWKLAYRQARVQLSEMSVTFVSLNRREH